MNIFTKKLTPKGTYGDGMFHRQQVDTVGCITKQLSNDTYIFVHPSQPSAYIEHES